MKQSIILAGGILLCLYAKSQTLQTVTDNGATTNHPVAIGNSLTVGNVSVISTDGLDNSLTLNQAGPLKIPNSFVGIGTSPAYKLHVAGGHYDTRMVLNFSHPNPAYHADLSLWASEPGITYTGVGIGNNVITNASAPHIQRINTLKGGSYIRMLDQELKFNVVQAGGTDINAMTINANGYTGIGTSSPNQRFDVNGGIGFANQTSVDKKLYSPVDGVLEWMTHNWAGEHGFAISHQGTRAVYFNTSGDSYLKGGNLGIGTTVPNYKLDIHDGSFSVTNNGQNAQSRVVDGTIITKLQSQTVGGTQGVVGTESNNDFSLVTNNSPRLTVYANGNIGVGTNSPSSDAKLTVAGKIHSREVKVTIDAGADFVFEKDYNLKPLAEVAEYISVNKHLPEIASAKEMEKNGIELGQMNIKLLQKIEELTLHLIEQNKLILEQNKVNTEQNKRIEELERSKNK